MNAEYLASWIESAEVDNYKSNNKEVFVASKGNEHLILACHRVKYPHGLHPHANIVWIKDGEAELVYQDILDEKFGQVIHSTGNISGDWGIRENVETIWCAMIKRLNNQTFYYFI